MSRFLILGAGRFGRLALQRLSERHPGASFCLVDQDLQASGLIFPPAGWRLIRAEAIAFLGETMAGTDPPDWIIPAIPRHVAFAWLWRQRPAGGGWRQVPVPAAVGRDLPFRVAGPAGELYLSLSTEQCPDDCPEPAAGCPLTGRPRKYHLYDYLAQLALPAYTSLVIRSRQLASGVGGYRPADLWHLRERALATPGNLFISTACRCHGVCHALAKRTGTEAGVGF